MSKISRVDVGTPPKDFEGWVAANVCFHGFAELPTARGEEVESPEFSCLGHQWVLSLYPGGDANSDERYVAIYLCNRSNTSIKISYGYSIRDVTGKEVVHYEQDTDEFSSWGYSNFAKRSTIMNDALVQGTLVVEVRIKLPSTGNNATQFIPTNPINKNVLELLSDEETADVIFEVVGGEGTNANTPQKSTTTAIFHAHRLMLKNNATALYDMCGASDGKGITTHY